jgi:uncharacterized membrane protein
MSALPIADVFAELKARGLVADAQLPPLAPVPAGTPWYVRVMAGFGAWLGGLFLLGSMMALFSVVAKSPGGMLTLGVFALAGAFGLYQVARGSDALEQLGLACSMAGQFAFGFGMEEMFHWDMAALSGFLFVLQVGLVVAMNGVLHRYLSALFAAIAAHWFLYKAQAVPLGGAVLAALVTWIWLNEAAWTAARRATFWKPVGYALALALLFWQAPLSLRWLFSWGRENLVFAVPGWVAPLAYALCLAAAVGWLARRQAPRAWPRWVAAALLVSAVAWLAPGLLAALLVLILGAAAGNRILVGLALLAAAWYLGAYYYQMQITLLEKSAVMLATGAVLIGLRFALSWLWPKEQAND